MCLTPFFCSFSQPHTTLHLLSCPMPVPIFALFHLPYASLPTLGYGKHGPLLTSTLAPVVGTSDSDVVGKLVGVPRARPRPPPATQHSAPPFFRPAGSHDTMLSSDYIHTPH
ncbi:hypothetical protein E2C01_066446 [Portunus trituberculatus]|uniref:Uncharacterized protein n=1 Tax=Portunus trituberculatus TaxID=210409 RepID=A0A5B7HLI8_PORTR|nr:hypothetical protein [Portunus trituberculatus]